ncbi:DEAH-box RNA helicase prp16, partial [Irineochytrium annulatum]
HEELSSFQSLPGGLTIKKKSDPLHKFQAPVKPALPAGLNRLAGSKTSPAGGLSTRRPGSDLSESLIAALTGANATPKLLPGSDGRIPQIATPMVPDVFTGGDNSWETDPQLDRDWYNNEESGAMDLDSHHQFFEYENYYKQKEEELAKTQTQKKMTAKQAQFNRDNDLWETNRMLTSGVVQRSESAMDDDDGEGRVHILVRDLKPPFLDGKMVYTKQIEPVQSVKDPTADLAVFSRAGSKVVRERREQEERRKATSKFNLEGTNLGNIMGIQKKAEKGEDPEAEVDYKGESQFSSFLKDKTDAVSAFARNKTLSEQREYLPVFAVREELLSVIRDNQ